MLRRRLSLVVLAATLVAAGAPPAALARVEPGPPTPPSMPTAVPSAPGALTGTHARTPADETAALAQERYLSSYGEPSAPLPRAERPVAPDAGDVPWLGIALAGAAVVLLAAAVVAQRAVLARRRPVGLR